jgi:hypothetical protein
MVTVVEYAIRKTKDDREFIALILQGGLHLAQSKQTGNFYATVKKCSIPSTFTEDTAKGMIGEKIPGSVQKTSCEPYDFVNKETGEVIQLDYRWAYVPEGATIEEAVFEGEPEVTMAKRKDPILFKPTV